MSCPPCPSPSIPSIPYSHAKVAALLVIREILSDSQDEGTLNLAV